MLGVGSVQLGRQTLDDQAGQKKAPHVCIITHHEQHLGPTMPSCATVERDAKRWLADNNDDDAGRDATTAALMREAWTVRLAACGSLAAACTAGFSYILANAPARFSRLHRGAILLVTVVVAAYLTQDSMCIKLSLPPSLEVFYEFSMVCSPLGSSLEPLLGAS